MDGIALNRELLPPVLLASLDGAGLGSRELLPSAVFTFLAAIGASAGPNVRFDPGHPSTGMATKDHYHDANGISLRVVLMAPDRQFSCVAPALLAAAYAVGNDKLDRWRVATDCEAAHRHATAYRKRLHDQAVTSATLLDIAPPAPWIEELHVKSGPRPHFVLRNAAGSHELRRALRGSH